MEGSIIPHAFSRRGETVAGKGEKVTGEGCEEEIERAVVHVGQMMALAARTAPKGVGQDYLEIRLVKGEGVDRMGQAMIEKGEAEGKAHFVRDGNSVLRCHAILLVGLLDHPSIGLDCGACGHGDCAGFERARNEVERGDFAPACSIRAIDLGIALGSAAKTAQIHNVDNRIMYRIAVMAVQLGLIGPGLCMGIPLAAVGKSPFFDR
jgi:uncharacterized ferredoxin-like protein